MEKFIRETIKSISSQTVKPKEIVVVDDASTDRTSRVVYEEFDKIVGIDTHLVMHRENKGIGVSRQDGVKYSKGDYIAFLSADDVYGPKFLEISSQKLSPKNGTFTDYYRWGYLEKNPLEVFKAPISNNQEDFRRDVIKWALQKNMFVMFSAIVMPKSWFEKISFEPELRHGEDGCSASNDKAGVSHEQRLSGNTNCNRYRGFHDKTAGLSFNTALVIARSHQRVNTQVQSYRCRPSRRQRNWGGHQGTGNPRRTAKSQADSAVKACYRDNVEVSRYVSTSGQHERGLEILKTEINKERDFKPANISIQIFGICKHCQKASENGVLETDGGQRCRRKKN